MERKQCLNLERKCRRDPGGKRLSYEDGEETILRPGEGSKENLGPEGKEANLENVTKKGTRDLLMS